MQSPVPASTERLAVAEQQLTAAIRLLTAAAGENCRCLCSDDGCDSHYREHGGDCSSCVGDINKVAVDDSCNACAGALMLMTRTARTLGTRTWDVMESTIADSTLIETRLTLTATQRLGEAYLLRAIARDRQNKPAAARSDWERVSELQGTTSATSTQVSNSLELPPFLRCGDGGKLPHSLTRPSRQNILLPQAPNPHAVEELDA